MTGMGLIGSFLSLSLPGLSVLVGSAACLNHFEQAAEWGSGMDWLALGSLRAKPPGRDTGWPLTAKMTVLGSEVSTGKEVEDSPPVAGLARFAWVDVRL